MTSSTVTFASRTPVVIDLAVLDQPLLVGRETGVQCRRQFELEAEDVLFAPVEVIIPESTSSMSNSFFLGMFGRSIHDAGSAEAFFKKYQFKTSKLLRIVIDACVWRALQERSFSF